MATTKAPAAPKKASSAIKRTHQSETRHARNTSILSRLKTDEKKLRAALASSSDQVKALFEQFISALDKAAKQGVIHKNAADRKKSRLNVRVAGGAAPQAAKKKTVVKKVVAKPKAKLKNLKKK